MKVKTFTYWLFLLLVISLSVFVFSSSIMNVIFDIDFYKKEFQKHKIAVEKPIEKSLLIMSYFRNDAEYLDQSSIVFMDRSFSQRELEHLKDVKSLVQRVIRAYNISLAVSLVLVFLALSTIFLFSSKKKRSYYFRKFFMQTIGYSSVLILLVIVIFAVAGFFFYDVLFTRFHESFFISGTWMFEETDLLIQLYPYGFFQDSFWQFTKVLFINLGIMFLLFLLMIFDFVAYLNRIIEKKKSES